MRVNVGKGSYFGVGTGVGWMFKGEIRSMSMSALCQGWSETDQERVPAVGSSRALRAGRSGVLLLR